MKIEILKWIDDRLASILEAPRMWGGRSEVVAQVLTLLEVRAKVLVPDVRDRLVLDSFQEFQSTTEGSGVLSAPGQYPHWIEENVFVEKIRLFMHYMNMILLKVYSPMPTERCACEECEAFFAGNVVKLEGRESPKVGYLCRKQMASQIAQFKHDIEMSGGETEELSLSFESPFKKYET